MSDDNLRMAMNNQRIDRMISDKREEEMQRWLKSMHQPHLECPSHELAYDEGDFQRVFGVGDEQQVTPQRTDQVQFDHGCRDGDFA